MVLIVEGGPGLQVCLVGSHALERLGSVMLQSLCKSRSTTPLGLQIAQSGVLLLFGSGPKAGTIYMLGAVGFTSNVSAGSTLAAIHAGRYTGISSGCLFWFRLP